MAQDNITQRRKVAGRPWDVALSHWAARRGDLAFLQWGRVQDPPLPWDYQTCLDAAVEGQLAVLQWLVTQTPPCRLSPAITMDFSIRAGQMEVVQWLVGGRLKVPLPHDIGTLVGQYGHVHFLDWLCSLNGPQDWFISKDILRSAKQHHQFAVLDWMISKHGWNVSTGYLEALGTQDCFMLQWLLTYHANSISRNLLPGSTSPTDDQKHYHAKQWAMAANHPLKWPTHVCQWLRTVEDVSQNLLTRWLCPDLVALIQRYC